MRTAMLGVNGRIDRLHFTAVVLLAGLVAAVATLTLLLALVPDDPVAANVAISDPAPRLLLVLGSAVVPLFVGGMALLVAARARDMGWRPAYVLAGLAAAILIDLAPAILLAVALPFPIGLFAGGALLGVLLLAPSRE